MNKRKIMTGLLSALIIMGSNTPVLANEKGPSQMAVESKMNSEILYVVEKENYREALSKNVLSVELKNNILPINTDDIQDENLQIISSADSYFTLGSLNNHDNLPKENVKGNIFYEEGQSFINLNNLDTEKNIIVTNQESMVDVINATQIGNIEDRNLLLIKDNRINSETITFLSEHGQDKNVLFIEGELEIPSELRNYILQLSGSPKYEIDTYKVIKFIEESKVELANFVPTNIPGSKPVIDNQNVSEVKEKVLDKVQKSSIESLDKTSKQALVSIENNTKKISYEVEPEKVKQAAGIDKTNEFIQTLKDSKESTDGKSLIQTNEEMTNNEITDEHVSLKLTYANPLSIHNYVPDSKEIYVTSKSTSNEIIYSVMEGDYGVGEERVSKLEKEGYNYQEIQEGIDKIVAQRVKEAKETEERIERERRAKEKEDNAIREKTARNNRTVNSSSSSELTTAFLNEALKMQGWDYSQPNRWANGQADCSSLVIRALINSGYTNDHSNMTTRTIMNDSRFYEISMGQIRKGDILWYSGHMEIYMGGDTTFGAFRPGKKAGYASGVNRFSRAFRLSGR